eukprot:m.49430 g.49430  ORF g.49430 m.49430 type:complete len:160 (+) comp16110_c0_seq1:159-638(+)
MLAMLLLATSTAFVNAALVSVYEEASSPAAQADPTPWIGQWIGVVGCAQATCCCPTTYFDIRNVAPLTFFVFGAVQGKCSGDAFFLSNGTVASPDADVMDIEGPRRGGNKYRVEYSSGTGTVNRTVATRNATSGKDASLFFRTGSCFFQLVRTRATTNT